MLLLRSMFNFMKLYSFSLFPYKDEVGYLKSLGMARTNEVMRDARIGEAEAKMATEVYKAT